MPSTIITIMQIKYVLPILRFVYRKRYEGGILSVGSPKTSPKP